MAGSTPASATADAVAPGCQRRAAAASRRGCEAWRRFRRHRLALAEPGDPALADRCAVLFGPLVWRVPINEIDFTARLQGPVVAASVRHRRPRPGPARAHALRRPHLAGGRLAAMAGGDHRRHDHRRDRRHVARRVDAGADVADRPVPVAAAAAAAAAGDLSVPRLAEGRCSAPRSASSS